MKIMENTITIEEGTVVETKVVRTDLSEYVDRKKKEIEQFRSQMELSTENFNRATTELNQLNT